MTPRSVLLDSGPLGLLSQRRGKSARVDDCRRWLEDLLAAGCRVYLPEIADYETRRELIRAHKGPGIIRLDRLQEIVDYLPISTAAMLKAAELWASMRNAGTPTATPEALDGDVILAAQSLTCGAPLASIIVATVNPGHLSRMVASDLWENIQP